MDLCSEDHEEVCFEGRYCPACSIRDDKDEKIADLEKEIDELNKEMSNMEDEIINLESRLGGTQ